MSDHYLKPENVIKITEAIETRHDWAVGKVHKLLDKSSASAWP